MDNLKDLKKELFNARYELELAKLAQDKDKMDKQNEKIKVIRSRISKLLIEEGKEKRNIK